MHLLYHTYISKIAWLCLLLLCRSHTHAKISSDIPIIYESAQYLPTKGKVEHHISAWQELVNWNNAKSLATSLVREENDPPQLYLVINPTDDQINVCYGSSLQFVAYGTTANPLFIKIKEMTSPTPIPFLNDNGVAVFKLEFSKESGIAGPGDYAVTVYEKDEEGNQSSESNTITVKVKQKPNISLEREDGFSSISTTDEKIKLKDTLTVSNGDSPIPADKVLEYGRFEGTGVSKGRDGEYYLYPGAFINDEGETTIQYIYTKDGDCPTTAETTITILDPNKILDINPSYCSNGSTEEITFNTTPIAPSEGEKLMEVNIRTYRTPDPRPITETTIALVDNLNPIFYFDPSLFPPGFLRLRVEVKSEVPASPGTDPTATSPKTRYYGYYTNITSPPELDFVAPENLCIGQPAIKITPTANGLDIPNSSKGYFVKKDSNGDPQKISEGFEELRPDKLGAGTHEIAYTYTDGNGCTNTSAYKTITVTQLNYTFSITGNDGSKTSVEKGSSEDIPEVNVCRGQALSFSPTVGEDDISDIQWVWNFGDETIADTITTTKVFNNLGTFEVTLNETNEIGCNNIQVLRVQVRPLPVADFTYSGACEDMVSFNASGSSIESETGEIKKYIWQFEEGGESITTNQAQISHKYTSYGKKRVELTVETNFGCTHHITKEVFVFPSFVLTSDTSYKEDFEKGTGGWIEHGIHSSWGISPPPAIEGQEGNAWVMNEGAGYNNDEHSFIESPCFNLDALTNPIISIRHWLETDENSDGLTLLATVDDGKSWNVVGSIGDGIDWYNSQGILGSPGEDASVEDSENSRKLGWSGTTEGWKTARYSLREVQQELEGNPASVGHVRFRLAFGSNGDNPTEGSFKGAAIDQVVIREKNRFIVLEHFTNTGSSDAQTEDASLTAFMEKPDNSNIIDIRYHTDFPDDDVLNAENKADPSARALHYGIPEVPRTVLDGTYFENKPFSEKAQAKDNKGWGEAAYTVRTLLDAPFDIDLVLSQEEKEEEALTIKATLQKNDSYEDESLAQNDLVVQVAVIEHLAEGSYRNVLRKLLPHAAGTRITKEWQTTGGNPTVIQTWSPDRDAKAGEFGVVVFVQDQITKEVYQAAYRSIDMNLTGTKSSHSDETNYVPGEEKYRISPNPSITYFTVMFASGHEPPADTPWVVYDSIGLVVASGTIKKGSKTLKIKIPKPGIYTFRLEKGEYEEQKIIRH